MSRREKSSSQGDQSSQSALRPALAPPLIRCPDCSVEVREDRLPRHRKLRCTGRKEHTLEAEPASPSHTSPITADRPEETCTACGLSVSVDRMALHQANSCRKSYTHCPDCGVQIASRNLAGHQKTRCPSRSAQRSSTGVPISPARSDRAAVGRPAALDGPPLLKKEQLPLTLYARRPSACHGARRLIVRSRDGGMVSCNCIDCGRPEYIRPEDFPEVSCSRCNVRFNVRKADGTNYFFVCGSCGKQMMIAKIVPAWSDRFQYHGLAAYGDEIFAI